MNNLVEIIGASGVGKTHFLEKIIKSAELPENWITQEKFKKIKHYDIQNKKFAKELINTVKNSLFSVDPISEYNKKIMSFIALRAYQDRYLFENSSSNQRFLLDDGIVHNLTTILLKEKNQSIAEKFFSERNFILLESNVEQILQNYQKRDRESPNNINNWYKIYSKEISKLKNKIVKDTKNASSIAKLAKKHGSTVIRVDLTLDFKNNLKQVLKLMTDKNINYLDKESFFRQAESISNGHWKSQPLELRWDYHSKALEVLKSIDIKQPSDVLEIGTVGVQLIENSDTLDQDKYWNYEGKQPTFMHDARNIPWPVENKYETIVALRVFQYLVPKQKEAFLEAKRLTNNLIVVVPSGEAYRPAGLENSTGITYNDFLIWNNNIKPNIFEKTSMGDFYYWKFN